jgi:hypothetical protein
MRAQGNSSTAPVPQGNRKDKMEKAARPTDIDKARKQECKNANRRWAIRDKTAANRGRSSAAIGMSARL